MWRNGSAGGSNPSGGSSNLSALGCDSLIVRISFDEDSGASPLRSISILEKNLNNTSTIWRVGRVV